MIRALLFVLAMLAPWPALAAEPTVALEVDVSALPDNKVTADLDAWLTEHQTVILRDGGIEISADADKTVRVVVSRYGEGDIHYRATIALVDRPTEAVELERTITCELCRDTDLATKVGEEVARVSGRLLYGGEDEPDGQAEPTPPEEQPANDIESTPKAKAIGPMGFAGIGSMVVGASMLGAGIPLVLRPDEWRPVPEGSQRRTTRPAGGVLIGVGSAALIAGAALVAVDVLRRKRQRTVSLAPSVFPTSLTLRMRF